MTSVFDAAFFLFQIKLSHALVGKIRINVVLVQKCFCCSLLAQITAGKLLLLFERVLLNAGIPRYGPTRSVFTHDVCSCSSSHSTVKIVGPEPPFA